MLRGDTDSVNISFGLSVCTSEYWASLQSVFLTAIVARTV